MKFTPIENLGFDSWVFSFESFEKILGRIDCLYYNIILQIPCRVRKMQSIKVFADHALSYRVNISLSFL